MDDLTDINTLKQECWRKRFYSFGTTKIFEKRVLSLGKKRRIITFLGIALPLFIGLYVGAYSLESEILKSIILPFVGMLTIVQAVVSAWSLVARWDETYTYAINAIKDNTRLTSESEKLATASEEEIRREIEGLRFRYSHQEAQDTVQEITKEEKRFAQRSALFQYRSECPTCRKVPESMTPSNCDSCGNF